MEKGRSPGTSFSILKPNEFKKISGNGLAPCIWELEIIYHERTSWINNILKEEQNPKINNYLEDVINREI